MLFAVLLSAAALASRMPAEEPVGLRRVVLPSGVEIHYEDHGTGTPVVFVHGSLSEGSYWHDQLPLLARTHRAIAYSRRHSPPNTNEARRGYSAAADAEDLAALIAALHLGRVHVVGHSYGGLTGLFLAARHPELVRSLVSAEAPAVSLLGGPLRSDIDTG